MIDAGVLENPKVDAALGMHVMLNVFEVLPFSIILCPPLMVLK